MQTQRRADIDRRCRCGYIAHGRSQTVSLYMLAMRGSIALEELLSGISVSLLGVQQALLINGALALAIHIAIRRQWLRSPLRTLAP